MAVFGFKNKKFLLKKSLQANRYRPTNHCKNKDNISIVSIPVILQKTDKAFHRLYKKITYFCKKQKNPSESDATEKEEVKHLNFQQK